MQPFCAPTLFPQTTSCSEWSHSLTATAPQRAIDQRRNEDNQISNNVSLSQGDFSTANSYDNARSRFVLQEGINRAAHILVEQPPSLPVASPV